MIKVKKQVQVLATNSHSKAFLISDRSAEKMVTSTPSFDWQLATLTFKFMLF